MHSFSVISTDDTPLAAYHWPAQRQPRAIVIIIHGMAEHARRYDAFARQLTAADLAVYAFDLRGHGATTQPPDHGHLGTQATWQSLLDDVEAVRVHAATTTGPLPIIVFGHSLGSFIAQGVIQTRGPDYAAAVLSGTATPRRIMCHLGALVATAESTRIDPTGRSRILRALSFGAYEKALGKRLGGTRGRFDWLSSRPQAVAAYNNDPATGFDLSAATWQRLLPGIARVQSPHARRQMPHRLPLLIAAGEDDPVGRFGQGPRRLATSCSNNGQSDVTTLLYANARHELLSDTVAAEFTHDMQTWLAARGLAASMATDSLCKTT